MTFSIHHALTGKYLDQARELMLSYVKTGVVDLTSQSIEAEIAGLPADYAPPTGTLFIATDDLGEATGCIALHKFGLQGDAEIKRLFVKAEYRGRGIGMALLNSAIDAAREMGYRRVVLDTLPTMTSAITIYKSLGFGEIAPYWNNVLPVLYFGKDLDAGVAPQADGFSAQ
ncbi:GNAT family N-acetyltransferase [Rhizobium sp. Root483D2]|uniref:GNAT family N-acetyltransferase n=1 Tax=Rhizobium sp. Root483D2 TaxID=1736545 RepID=UPI00071419EC|nr:GNAT family N-acetyltransferase [Rhizobium sp. Root483D2]KQY48602.1 hypothetical protein ASD32_09430 [Rhizobium sp. Root483D2]